MYLLKLLKKKVRNMSKIKIYELADKLGIERKELLSKAQEFGISAKSTSKSLSDAEVLKLENFYKKSDTSEVIEKEEPIVETKVSKTTEIPEKRSLSFQFFQLNLRKKRRKCCGCYQMKNLLNLNGCQLNREGLWLWEGSGS